MSDTGLNTNDQAVTPEALAELRANASRAPRLDRENAMLRAGITTEGPVADAFMDRYAGELTIDAIRAEAQKWGLWAPAPAATNTPPATDPAATPPANAQQQQPPATGDPFANVPDAGQQATRDALGGGIPAGSAPPQTPDPTDAAFVQFHQDLARGMPRDRAGLGVIDRLVVAAANGDKRVIFDPEAYRQQALENQ